MIDLTTGKVSSRIIRFTLPMLLGNVFQQMYNIVDSIIVGKYIGKQALAAVGASFPIIFVLISLIIGIASGFTIIIAQYYGAKDMDKVRRSIDTMLLFLLIASLITTIIGIAIAGPVLRLIHVPAEVFPYAKLYLQIYIGGLVLLFGYNGTAALLRGLGDSKTPLYFLILSTIINIILVWLFVVKFHWGVLGAGIATVIAQGVAFFASIIYLNRTHEIIKITFRKMTFDKEILSKSFSIGLPSGIQQTLVALGMIALFRIVNDFGTDVVAAFSVAGRIDSFAGMPAMNFAAALSTFVGQNIGANKSDRVKKGFEVTLILSTIVSLSVTLLVVFFGRSLMQLFTTDQTVIELGYQYLLIVGLFYIVFSALFINHAVMRGAGDTLIPMLITLLSLWIIRIPLSWWLSKQYGVTGIWWSIPVAWSIGCLLSYLYYKTGRWKKKAVVKYKEPEPVET